MTAKQRAARAKFKAVVAEAKKLRKKNPKLTQAQAVKQAFAISYSKAGKKKVGYSKARQAVNKNATAWLKNRKYTGKDEGESKKEKIEKAYLLAPYGKPQRAVGKIKKKAATKVKAKKSRSTEMHTDTKSHNVNIKVVSGIDTNIQRQMNMYKGLVQRAKEAEIKYKKEKDPGIKYLYKLSFDRLKNEIRERKFVMANMIKELKKF
jgi:hypothetical protein